MKKISLLAIIAAVAMVSCSNTYEAKTVELTNVYDSVNYALGLVNANSIKMQQFRSIDSTEYKAATFAFMDGLVAGYEEEEKEEPSEVTNVAQNVAYSAQEMEKNGVAGVKAWTINEKVFFQGLVNAMLEENLNWTADSAREYFQTQYQNNSGVVEEVTGKTVKAKCPKKSQAVELKNQLDSINYAFGLLNGDQIRMYVLSGDTTGTAVEEFITALNNTLKDGKKYPMLRNLGERIGGQIKEQEETGLVGVPGLVTDFELIKQGFINGFLDYGDWDAMMANMFIQESLNELQYGDAKREGEEFLAAKELEEGVQKTESGLLYKVIREGKGNKPAVTDKVRVNYEGKLINGTVFDSSYERGESIVFGVNQVIKGWTEALQLMPVGSEYELYIPYYLAYGERGTGRDIPPYATLIFKVELIGIEK